MQQAAARTARYPDYVESTTLYSDGRMACDWQRLRGQLLAQWIRLTKTDLDSIGPNRHRIAALVQRKYGVSAQLVENYLINIERTLPVL